jgi:hypothetical protein
MSLDKEIRDKGGRRPEPESIRFARLISPEPNTGCWLWGGCGERYGVFWANNRNDLAHRFSYETFVGPIPAGYHVDHLCRVTCCVNPDHLEAVPPVVNANRKPEQKNQYQNAVSCINGHPFSGTNLRIGKNGVRVCRACADERRRRWKAERRHEQ